MSHLGLNLDRDNFLNSNGSKIFFDGMTPLLDVNSLIVSVNALTRLIIIMFLLIFFTLTEEYLLEEEATKDDV